MNLTKEQQDILDGKQGDVLAKVMHWCGTEKSSAPMPWCP